MGKSPGKWIKSLLFGKKSFRPRSSKGRDALKSASEDAVSGGNGLAASIHNASPVIPGSLSVSTSNPELERETPSRLGCNVSPEPFKEGIQQKNGAVATSAADNSEKSREDQAATMVQAVFRGYLARRAFYVLKGIIRLQALIRGHLVRRQAVSTIHSTLAIIKFQAVFRGHRVRASGSGVEVCSKFHAMVIKRMDSQEKLYAHKLVRKLLSSSIISLPLKIHYAQSEPNSSYSWMERWTFSGFWKSASQPRKVIETKPHGKKSTYAMETESIRLKRNVRKSPLSGDGGSLSVTSDLEKPKRSIRKIYSPPLDTTTENQPSELEKVKRNLRKISSSILGADNGENGSEKSSCNPNKLLNEQSDVPNQIIDAPVNEIKQEDELTLVKEKESVVVEGKGSSSNDCNSVEMNQSQSVDRYANPEMNDGLDFTEEQISHENHNSRKRTSLSAKLEYSDNSVQNTRTLPSYMAATESAKAKHRIQTSPRFSSESAEKNGIIRRHSLPSTNGKLSSFSPRSQRPVQGLAKGVINNRCLLSSRDGNEKLVQVEWRR